MSVLPVGFGSSGGIDTGDIPASLRFRRSASASITTSTNPATTSTYFCLFKQGALGAINPIFDGNIKINANNTITAFGLTTTAVARDPTSFHWIHVSNNGLVFDGVNLGAVTTSAITGLRLGYDGTNYADMYGARMCVVSGTSLPYTDFVSFNTTINEWVVKSKSAIKALVDAGDAESSMYEFDDATSLTTLGYDESSKANNATLNNFSLTAGPTYDHMLDVPGNSYATWNPLFPTTNTISNGNLRGALAASLNAGYGIRSTIAMASGKYEAEFVPVASADTWSYLGVCPASLGVSDVSIAGSNAVLYRAGNGNKNVNGTATAYGASWTTEAIRIAVDMDARTVTFYKAGVSQGAISLPSSTADYVFVMSNGNATTFTADANFGQQPITLDSGFKALCQANLEEPAILNPEDHHVDIPVTKSGDTPFTLPWDADTYDTFFEIKRRNSTGDWYQIDGLRGYTKILKSNSTAAETTDANVLGVSGTTCTLKSTLADGTYIVSATKAGLSASRQTNTDGSITSTVSRNVDSGFAIVTWTGNGVSGATVGHGMGKLFSYQHTKMRSNINNWIGRHVASGWGSTIYLNATTAASADTGSWTASPTPTSTIFTVGNANTNSNGETYVAYCYADSAIQKSFSYTGNGSADGPNPNLGFKCGRSLFKNAGGAGNNWLVFDSTRDTSNLAQNKVAPNAANAENDAAVCSVSENNIDMLSLSIKMRTTNGQNNGSGNTIIGHAWAAVTGKYSLAR